jgi:hypothetical protein
VPSPTTVLQWLGEVAARVPGCEAAAGLPAVALITSAAAALVVGRGRPRQPSADRRAR